MIILPTVTKDNRGLWMFQGGPEKVHNEVSTLSQGCEGFRRRYKRATIVAAHVVRRFLANERVHRVVGSTSASYTARHLRGSPSHCAGPVASLEPTGIGALLGTPLPGSAPFIL